MLSTLFAKDLAPEIKLDILHNEYGMMISETLEQEVREMGGMGQLIYEDGVKEGRKQGRKQGRTQGLLLAIRRVMKKLDMTAAEAMDMMELSAEDREALLAML